MEQKSEQNTESRKKFDIDDYNTRFNKSMEYELNLIEEGFKLLNSIEKKDNAHLFLEGILERRKLELEDHQRNHEATMKTYGQIFKINNKREEIMKKFNEDTKSILESTNRLNEKLDKTLSGVNESKVIVSQLSHGLDQDIISMYKDHRYSFENRDNGYSIKDVMNSISYY